MTTCQIILRSRVSLMKIVLWCDCIRNVLSLVKNGNNFNVPNTKIYHLVIDCEKQRLYKCISSDSVQINIVWSQVKTVSKCCLGITHAPFSTALPYNLHGISYHMLMYRIGLSPMEWRCHEAKESASLSPQRTPTTYPLVKRKKHIFP